MRTESAPITSRMIHQSHCTGAFQGEKRIVKFPNPGESLVVKFHDQYYWHKPIYRIGINDEAELVGHSLFLSKLPQGYLSFLKANDSKEG